MLTSFPSMFIMSSLPEFSPATTMLRLAFTSREQYQQLKWNKQMQYALMGYAGPMGGSYITGLVLK